MYMILYSKDIRPKSNFKWRYAYSKSQSLNPLEELKSSYNPTPKSTSLVRRMKRFKLLSTRETIFMVAC